MQQLDDSPHNAHTSTVGAIGRAWRGFFSNAYLLLTLTPLFWAGNFIVGRAVVGHIPPAALAWLRWSIASLILLPIAWRHLARDWPLVRSHWRILLVLAITGPSLFNVMTYLGLNYTTAINGLVLQSAGPVLIVIASYILFAERVSWRQAVGIAISLPGVLVVVARGDLATLMALRPNIGDLLVLAAFVLWAVYSALLRKRPAIHWLSFAAVTAVVAALTNFPLFLAERMMGARLVVDLETVLAVLYVAIFPSLLSYNFYNRGVELIGANRAGVFLHLVPLFGAGMAIGLLGEALHLFHIIGLVLIVSGVSLAARST